MYFSLSPPLILPWENGSGPEKQSSPSLGRLFTSVSPPRRGIINMQAATFVISMQIRTRVGVGRTGADWCRDRQFLFTPPPPPLPPAGEMTCNDCFNQRSNLWWWRAVYDELKDQGFGCLDQVTGTPGLHFTYWQSGKHGSQGTSFLILIEL